MAAQVMGGRQRRVSSYYEIWVLWFRGFAGLGLLVAITTGFLHRNELRDADNLLPFLLLLFVVGIFTAFTEWTFRVRRFVKISTDFETIVQLSNSSCRISCSLEEFCSRLMPSKDGIGFTLRHAEGSVFISRRHWAISRLLRKCQDGRSRQAR